MEAEHKNGKYPVRERRLRVPLVAAAAGVGGRGPRYCNGFLSAVFPKLAGKDVKRLEVTIEEPAGELPERAA